MIIAKDISLGHGPFLNECKNHKEMIKATTIPIKGARKMNAMILRMVGPSIEERLTAPPVDNNACAIAAPPKPPIRVCEELEGMPNHQVIRFQPIAATRPARITDKVIYSDLTVLAIVLATPWSKIK